MNHPSPSSYWVLSHPDRYLSNFLKISNNWDCTGLASKSCVPFSFITWQVSLHMQTKRSSSAFSDHIHFLASPQWPWRMRLCPHSNIQHAVSPSPLSCLVMKRQFYFSSLVLLSRLRNNTQENSNRNRKKRQCELQAQSCGKDSIHLLKMLKGE